MLFWGGAYSMAVPRMAEVGLTLSLQGLLHVRRRGFLESSFGRGRPRRVLYRAAAALAFNPSAGHVECNGPCIPSRGMWTSPGGISGPIRQNAIRADWQSASMPCMPHKLPTVCLDNSALCQLFTEKCPAMVLGTFPLPNGDVQQQLHASIIAFLSVAFFVQ